MSRTIKRGAAPQRPSPRRKQPVRKVSVLDRVVQCLPVSEAVLKRTVTWTMTGAAGAVVLAGLMWLGVPGMVGAALAETAGQAGLRVEQIEITGLKRMDRMSVYAVALEDKQNETSMMAVDLDGIRQRLLRYGWIADAHVSRRLPDTLLIDIVERTPAAVWQDRGQLTLIDADGVLLEAVRPDAIPDLPLVIGPGADRQEASYQALLNAAPALKPRVRAATWVGNRRWDLTFESGEVLALPEEGAAKALVTFAELDGQRPLLGRGWLRFDMRDPSKLVARKPGMNQNHALADPALTGAPDPAESGATAGEANAAGAAEG
ncbi:cell division protein FtsQ/DivIB [Sphingomonas rubra]|uniref:Cell division protein FtsQ n=1 Tax=Sphingomonas rubra TaxID=634430 RepID=A0A1I5SS78_9SPHN|nr:cell division protein FtsQ/DivIB [Sphingomonas rubra]SFP73654.1 cell division protein FtsQ [Sphingomonas rubra]